MDTPANNVEFSAQAVWDGYWEFFHDDDCGAVLDPDTKICAACGWRPDLQSMGARRTDKSDIVPDDGQWHMTGVVSEMDENLICGRQIGTYSFEYSKDFDHVLAQESLIKTLQLGLAAWKKYAVAEN